MPRGSGRDRQNYSAQCKKPLDPNNPNQRRLLSCLGCWHRRIYCERNKLAVASATSAALKATRLTKRRRLDFSGRCGIWIVGLTRVAVARRLGVPAFGKATRLSARAVSARYAWPK